MCSQTKHDIKNLRYILVVTHVRSNHTNFKRFWAVDKGAESFEIRPPTVHSNFSKREKTHYTTRFAKARKIWNHRVSAFNICQLSMFPMHIHKNGRFSSVFQCFKLRKISWILILNKFPAKWLVLIKPHLLFHGHR